VPASRIVVTRRLPQAALDVLEEAGELWLPGADRPLEPAELREAAAGAAALVTLLHDTVDAALLDAAGDGLRCVANVAVGYDNVDLDAAHKRGVVVTNTPGVLTDATADLTIALLLAVTRRIGEGERLIRSERNWAWDLDFMLGEGIQDRLLGIVGLGAIGTAVARRARAFGMRVAYAGRNDAQMELVAELGAERLELDDLMQTADVVSLHVPLTAETRHLIDARRLGLMRPSAFLINAARGPVVDEAALAAALEAGDIAGAGLDVFEEEPAVHPGLTALENVVLLPHLGSATVEARTAMAVLAARNAAAVLAGEPALTPVA
jgi:lactate dehydrogenase-like 2-hydroxyacid dehydrogenase